jgi:hypothetical protein
LGRGENPLQEESKRREKEIIRKGIGKGRESLAGGKQKKRCEKRERVKKGHWKGEIILDRRKVRGRDVKGGENKGNEGEEKRGAR